MSATALALQPPDWDRLALAELTAWPGELTARLKRLAELDPTTPAAWYAEQWECGRLELMSYGPRAWVLWRIEDRADGGRELVVVAAVSEAAGGDRLTRSALPDLEQFARQHGCGSIRLHTSRAGLVAIAAAAGWHVAEHVVRKDL